MSYDRVFLCGLKPGMTFLRSDVPEGLQPLIDYFDATYVTGTYRSIRRQAPARTILRRTPPLYPVDTWNVHDATMSGEARTNNLCESWNSGFARSVGHTHPSVWVLIGALRTDAALAETDILATARGQPPKKRLQRATISLQKRLRQICADRQTGKATVAGTLDAAAHTIRFA